MATLYIVATPIGNLGDITTRALQALKDADVIACEDTRHTLKLLNFYKIKRTLTSYHQHSKIQKIEYIIGLLRDGKNVALVSDAGTPAISDPGGILVEKVFNELGNTVSIVPIPGASAVTTLLSVAGIPTDKFLFLGFLPHKKGRSKIFDTIMESDITVCFYESPHRILKTLTSLAEVLSDDRRVIVGRELTKKFETIYRGSIHEVLQQLTEEIIRGEFVVAIESK